MAHSELYEDIVEVKCYIEGVLFKYVSSLSIEMSSENTSFSFVIPDSTKLVPELLTGASVFFYFCDRRVRESLGKTINSDELPILCAGEIRSYSRSMSVGSRSINISCMSSARHYSQTLLHFISPGEDRDVSNNATIAERTMFIGNRKWNYQFSGNQLTIRDRIQEAFQRRLDEIKNDDERNLIYSSINNDIMRLAKDSISFRIADSKFKLSQRFGSYADPDVQAMLEINNYKSILSDKADTLPANASVKDLLDLSSELISYSWIHIAKPTLSVKTDEEILKSKSSRIDFQSGEELFNGVDGNLIGVSKSVSQGQLYALQTDCETIGQIVKAGGDIRKAILETNADISSFIKETKRESVQSFFSGCVRIVNSIVDNLDTRQAIRKAIEIRILEDGIIPESDIEVGATPGNFQENLSSKVDIDSIRLSDTLIEYVSVPNLDFAQPPRCNVIHYSHMHSYNISVDEFGSPTRLLATANTGPGGIKSYYLAPSSAVYYKVSEDKKLYGYSEQYRNRIVSNKKNAVKK